MQKKEGFNNSWPLQAAAYFYAGISEEAMAQAFGISVREFKRLCRKHPEFTRAVSGGKLDDPME